MALQPKRTISKEDKGNITVDFDIYAPREGNSLTQLRKSRAVADNSVVLQRNLHNTSQTDRKVTSGYSIQSYEHLDSRECLANQEGEDMQIISVIHPGKHLSLILVGHNDFFIGVA